MDADKRRSSSALLPINDLTELVIGCAFRVSTGLGPGFLEKVYENALALELRRSGLQVEQQYPVSVLYTGEVVGEYIVDLYVDRRLIIELKVAKTIDPIHVAQCINYLKATGHNVGLLMNFAKPRLEYKRLVHQHPES
ncbi:MAG: GxxExxY protein [Planctomycetota bacterium]